MSCTINFSIYGLKSDGILADNDNNSIGIYGSNCGTNRNARS